MAWPTPKRLATFACLAGWLGIQTLFFIPRGWPQPLCAFVLKSNQGDFDIFQNGRDAVVIGAFSDRYQRFPKLELVPFLKKKGIRRINKLVLTGHDQSQTGALVELQKNFHVEEVFYPPDSALRMRKTFNQIERNTKLKCLVPGILEESVAWKIECSQSNAKGVILKIKGDPGFMIDSI